uniref:Uncharacterized protein n=1 Tax=Neobodo designis TaxID=312471 RepID=A0A7S1W8I9_NEODS
MFWQIGLKCRSIAEYPWRIGDKVMRYLLCAEEPDAVAFRVDDHRTEYVAKRKELQAEARKTVAIPGAPPPSPADGRSPRAPGGAGKRPSPTHQLKQWLQDRLQQGTPNEPTTPAVANQTGSAPASPERGKRSVEAHRQSVEESQPLQELTIDVPGEDAAPADPGTVARAPTGTVRFAPDTLPDKAAEGDAAVAVPPSTNVPPVRAPKDVEGADRDDDAAGVPSTLTLDSGSEEIASVACVIHEAYHRRQQRLERVAESAVAVLYSADVTQDEMLAVIVPFIRALCDAERVTAEVEQQRDSDGAGAPGTEKVAANEPISPHVPSTQNNGEAPPAAAPAAESPLKSSLRRGRVGSIYRIVASEPADPAPSVATPSATRDTAAGTPRRRAAHCRSQSNLTTLYSTVSGARSHARSSSGVSRTTGYTLSVVGSQTDLGIAIPPRGVVEVEGFGDAEENPEINPQ